MNWTSLPDGAPSDLRDRYRAERGVQIIHDSFHRRGFVTSYRLDVAGEPAGYASIGGYQEDPPVTLKELYLLPDFRPMADLAVGELRSQVGFRKITAQTNDPFLMPYVVDAQTPLQIEHVFFLEGPDLGLSLPAATVRDRRAEDVLFEHTFEPEGDVVVEVAGRIVASAGYLSHYNPPWVDIYMEVEPAGRGRGYGPLAIQGAIRKAHAHGLKCGARTGMDNLASRRSLTKAGMFVAGHTVTVDLPLR